MMQFLLDNRLDLLMYRQRPNIYYSPIILKTFETRKKKNCRLKNSWYTTMTMEILELPLNLISVCSEILSVSESWVAKVWIENGPNFGQTSALVSAILHQISATLKRQLLRIKKMKKNSVTEPRPAHRLEQKLGYNSRRQIYLIFSINTSQSNKAPDWAKIIEKRCLTKTSLPRLAV